MVFGCDEAVPFHVAPGVFHAKPEFHVNDCGMEPDCARRHAPLSISQLGTQYALISSKRRLDASELFSPVQKLGGQQPEREGMAEVEVDVGATLLFLHIPHHLSAWPAKFSRLTLGQPRLLTRSQQHLCELFAEFLGLGMDPLLRHYGEHSSRREPVAAVPSWEHLAELR